MTTVELLPGPLPTREARWARESRLVAADGVLEVHRGRRVQRLNLSGCLVHPAPPARDLAVSVVVVVAGPDGEARCAIDLAEWVPGGSLVADRRAGRRLGEPFGDLRDALAAALGARVSSTEWTREVPTPVHAADPVAVRLRTSVLLALAVVAVVAPVPGPPAIGLVGGVAAIALVLLGVGPVRRWHPRSVPVAWTVRAGHLGDEASLAADGSALWVLDSTTDRAGALPIGTAAWQVDRASLDDAAVQLSMGDVLAVDLPRDAWGDAFAPLCSRLERVDGLAVRERSLDRRVVTATATLRATHRPGSVGRTVALAALAAVAGLCLPLPVAVPYGVAAAVALALAAELVVARRHLTRKDAA